MSDQLDDGDRAYDAWVDAGEPAEATDWNFTPCDSPADQVEAAVFWHLTFD